MDLIYIILSVFLRLLPVRKLSNVSDLNNGRDLVELAVWIPLVGWVSVSVQHVPEAIWLTWRVRNVQSFDQTTLNSGQQRRWEFYSRQRGSALPSPLRSPDVPGDSKT